MNWFYFHCILALVILVKDYNGTLEEDLNKFEERLGIRTELPPDSSKENVPPPYYINPREETENDTTRYN